MNWEQIKDQLERYGGEPHHSLLPALTALTDLNDDLQNMRHLTCIVEGVDKVKSALHKGVI